MGFETCGPNEVIVVSGCCHSQPQLVPGGRVFVWPGIQQIQRLSLNTITLTIDTPNVYTQLGVQISVTGIAQVKVDSEIPSSLAKACEQFLGKSDREIQSIAKETLEGHQRAMMGNMTVEEIYKDRKKFSESVFHVATMDLVNMGLKVVSYTLKDIRDDEGYLRALGMARTAQVKKDARVGEAEARRDAGIKEAIAEEQKMQARYANDIDIAQSKRDYELKQAAYDMEVQTKKAEADLAYNLQAAKTKQRIKEEQMEVQVVERSLQIQVQEQEIVRRDRELEATIKKPAEAEVYRLTKIAEANKNKIVLEAQAEAESVRVKGEAEAYAIEAKARAEAEQMAKKADAWKEYQDAAIVDMILEAMPQIAAEVAAPLSQCKKVTMVTSGKGDVGAAKLTGEVFDIIERLPKMVEGMTGVELSKMVKTQTGRR